MHHMVILRHTAESCPGRPDNEAVIPCVNQLHQLLQERSIKAVGRWADPPGHVNYLVLDAPDAHTILQALMDSGIVAYTTAEIIPVLSMD